MAEDDRNHTMDHSVVRSHDFSVGKFDDRTVILCDQCEKEYHVGCLRENELCDLKGIPQEKWFCCGGCSRIYAVLQSCFSSGPQTIPTPLLDTICRKYREKGIYIDNSDTVQWRMLSGKYRSLENQPLLSRAATIFRVCLDNSDVVSAALHRIFDQKVAELPMVATCREYHGRVSDVNKAIETVQGATYPAALQMLIHQGKVLKDETSLGENNVVENSFIVIMLSKAQPAQAVAAAPQVSALAVSVPQPTSVAATDAVPSAGNDAVWICSQGSPRVISVDASANLIRVFAGWVHGELLDIMKRNLQPGSSSKRRDNKKEGDEDIKRGFGDLCDEYLKKGREEAKVSAMSRLECIGDYENFWRDLPLKYEAKFRANLQREFQKRQRDLVINCLTIVGNFGREYTFPYADQSIDLLKRIPSCTECTPEPEEQWDEYGKIRVKYAPRCDAADGLIIDIMFKKFFDDGPCSFVVISDDGDFRGPAADLKQNGCKIFVVSPLHCNRGLRDVADGRVIPLRDVYKDN